MKVLLFGPKAASLHAEVAKHPSLRLVEEEPDVVISYGGDGTLLTAERRWPGVPKVPIRNSRRGHRTLPYPPNEVLKGLVDGGLMPLRFIKLDALLRLPGQEDRRLIAMNEFNVHMGHVNSAVRFKVWLNDDPYGDGVELIGDGLLVSTPFGSTAYYNNVTRGIFYEGIGVAFKYVAEHTTHLVLPENVRIRIAITRGPAVLAYDSALEYVELCEGAELEVTKAPDPAVILTYGTGYRHPSQVF
jgi:NAD+ kinase